MGETDQEARHAPLARLDRWAPVARGAALAATAVEAAQLHRDGKMSADQYRQRREGLAEEARRHSCEVEYQAALAAQMDAGAAGMVLGVLERMLGLAKERYDEAILGEQEALHQASVAQSKHDAAMVARLDAHALLAQVEQAIAAVKRSAP